jgi:two-component system, chemotaxis family, protein-glutamate methylesterase/glutaminase
MNNEPKYIVVVGASAGGFHSIIELVAQLHEGMDVAVLIVLHFRKLNSDSAILQRLQTNSAFKCKVAEHGDVIESKHVYIGVPDKHLLVKNGMILLGMGPQENLWRPSIDVLFRSAAAAYDSRTIGIILSGLMYDGTSGMIAIKRSGGCCIVQEPKQAEYPDMIQSVLENVEVDYCVPLEDIGAIIEEKTKNGIHTHIIPDDVKAEAEIAERNALGIATVEALGERSPYICPDCGGGLWEMVSDNIIRYRCHTGHVYNSGELLIRQSDALENTLWTALRMMEERRNLLDKMSTEEKGKGWHLSAENKEERSKDLQVHINRLKDILYATKKD